MTGHECMRCRRNDGADAEVSDHTTVVIDKSEEY